MPESQPTYQPRDTLANTGSSTLQTTLAGAIFAGVQNTLRKQNVGAMGIFTHSGGIIGTFAAVGAAYQFTLDATANIRQKDDTYNDAIAGAVSGAVLGITRRSIPFTFGGAAAMSTVMATFRYTNGMGGWLKGEDEDEDEVAAREAYKKMRRRPLSETIEQLGEGRGIYAPGHEERRRQRLLEKYGVDVKEELEKRKKSTVPT